MGSPPGGSPPSSGGGPPPPQPPGHPPPGGAPPPKGGPPPPGRAPPAPGPSPAKANQTTPRPELEFGHRHVVPLFGILRLQTLDSIQQHIKTYFMVQEAEDGLQP